MTRDDCEPYRSIGSVDIVFALTPPISYDTLANGLSLSPGIYDLHSDLVVSMCGRHTATATVEIVSEPATIRLVGLGGLVLLAEHRE